MKNTLKIRMLLPLFTVLLLPLCACSTTINNDTNAVQSDGRLILTAVFQYEDGEAFQDGSACISYEQQEDIASLNEEGSAEFPSVPQDGEVKIALLDDNSEEIADMLMEFTTGLVTDASTDEDGIGHISVKSGAEQLNLLMTLTDEHTLQCSLYLIDER